MALEPALLTITLSTPIGYGQPITLDAIIAADLAEERGDEYALSNLPFAMTDGVPHASQLFLDSVRLNVNRSKIRAVRPHEAPIGEVVGSGKDGRIVTSYGRYKNLKNDYTAIAAYQCIFAFTGDLDRIEECLQHIPAIGRRRQDGLGLIQEYFVEPVNQEPDWWGIKDLANQPVRPLPLATWRGIGGDASVDVQAVRARPFYWDGTNPVEPCAMPASDSIKDIRLF